MDASKVFYKSGYEDAVKRAMEYLIFEHIFLSEKSNWAIDFKRYMEQKEDKCLDEKIKQVGDRFKGIDASEGSTKSSRRR